MDSGSFSDTALVARADEWLAPYLKLNGSHVITAGGLVIALKAMAVGLGGQIDAEVPESVTLPTGVTRAINYGEPEPSLEVRIQEVFGMPRSPTICGVPLTLRLLSPARIPLQITRDLESFWRVTYAEVRKEMRGRYPKHYWPENPLSAQPTANVPRKRER
jgi:ATP-dependent helicase HrpB